MLSPAEREGRATYRVARTVVMTDIADTADTLYLVHTSHWDVSSCTDNRDSSDSSDRTAIRHVVLDNIMSW